jgi:hypothetical protein
MPLRRTSGCACVRIGLAAVALATAATPSALAAEKPRPDALWKAFPLDPASERPAAPLVPPTQGRPEATTVIDSPSEASGPSVVVLVLATLLALLATVVVLSGRRLYLGMRDQRSSPPLWQGLAWPHSSDTTRGSDESGVRASPALVGSERRAAEPHPDVPAPRYRWADESPARRSGPFVGAGIGSMIHRLRMKVWTEETAAAITGGSVAILVGVLLIYLIG